jgi:K+-sensing histidine kinase KdpD
VEQNYCAPGAFMIGFRLILCRYLSTFPARRAIRENHGLESKPKNHLSVHFVMEIKNAKRWATGGLEPYYAAFVGYILAFAVRYTLMQLFDDHLPMLFFAINCIVIAFLYGFWPSFLILLVSIPTALFFFVKPFNEFGGFSERDFFLLILYFTLISLMAFMFELLRRAQYKSELIARVSESRYRLLVEADEERRAIMDKAAGSPG